MSEGNYLQEEQDDKKEAEVGNKPAYFRRRVEGVLVILRRSLRTSIAPCDHFLCHGQ
jgi:hypothetical protein